MLQSSERLSDKGMMTVILKNDVHHMTAVFVILG
jgi:hypothetical protein